jgi:hypothetical protein
MKTIFLHRHEQLLEIDNNIGAKVVAMMELVAAVIVEASIGILLMQYNSKWAKNMK